MAVTVPASDPRPGPAGPGVTPWVAGLLAFVMFARASAILIPERPPRKVH